MPNLNISKKKKNLYKFNCFGSHIISQIFERFDTFIQCKFAKQNKPLG